MVMVLWALGGGGAVVLEVEPMWHQSGVGVTAMTQHELVAGGNGHGGAPPGFEWQGMHTHWSDRMMMTEVVNGVK